MLDLSRCAHQATNSPIHQLSNSNSHVSECDFLDAHPRVGCAMTFRAAHAFAAFLLEHPDLRSARLALDDGDDADVGDKRCAGYDLATVLFDQQHLREGQLGAGLSSCSVDPDEVAGHHLDLTTTRLND